MKKLLLMVVAAILLCSCVGLTNISTPNSIALNQGNFKFIKTVSAETNACYVLGIGGLSSMAATDVVEKLKYRAQLQPNQALADIRIKKTIKLWVFGIVTTRTLTATASVVEFLDAEKYVSNGNLSITEQNSLNNVKYDKIVDNDLQKAIDKQRNPAMEFTPTENKDTRGTMYKRLGEIISVLRKNAAVDKDAITQEINNMEKWYETYGYKTWGESRGIEIAKNLLLSE
jgi:hypothetical protein